MSNNEQQLRIILGLSDIQQEFRAKLTAFFNVNPHLTTAIPNTAILKWATLKVDDVLNSHLQWADCPLSKARDYLRELLPWYGEDSADAMNRSLFHEFVVDDIVMRRIYGPIAENIGVTWKIWDVSTTREGDLLLEEGIDYRIHEWYRMTGREQPAVNEG